MTRPFLVLIFCFLFIESSCTPITKNLADRKFSKVFEGFTDDDNFQVICQSRQTIINYSENRSQLLSACRDRLVSTLAKFKVAYEYNTDQIRNKLPDDQVLFYYFPSKGKKNKNVHDSQNREDVTNYDISSETQPVSSLDQIVLEWKPSQLEKIRNLYKALLPGRVTHEWVDSDKIFIVYAIQKKGLIHDIKNIELPFGLEF